MSGSPGEARSGENPPSALDPRAGGTSRAGAQAAGEKGAGPAGRAAAQNPGSAESGSSNFAQKIQVLAGLLVAGFAGALNFLGLRSGEVSAVLRNQPHYPTLVLALLVAGILTAVASIFVSPVSKVPKWAWRATASTLVVPAALTVALIPITGVTHGFEDWLAVAVAAGGGLLAFMFCCLPVKRRRAGIPPWVNARFPDHAQKSRVLTQGLLVFTAIALTSTATYAALRLETRSQLASTAAQLTATITETSATASLHLAIDASKMASADRVYVSVTGLHSGTTIRDLCAGVPRVGTLTCDQAPCYVSTQLHRKFAACQWLESGIYQPDADGSVQQTIDLPFSDVLFQRLELVSEVCAVVHSGNSCRYQNDVTRVDIQVPAYAR
jgi:hypothetical protein